MFTFPDSLEVPRVDGKPAHMDCYMKHLAHKKAVLERIEYLTTLKPKTAEEEEAVHKEMMQLTGKE